MTSHAPRRLLETALYAADLDTAEEFYGGLLGLEKVSRAGDRHVFYRCGQGMLLVFNPEETRTPSRGPLPVPEHGTSGAGHACFAASAAEIDGWRRVFLAHGIAIDADFRWPNGARSLYVRDPAGNSIEFAEPRLWELAD
ncbi:MAG: VOC family protein [Geminicoccaceae bacterium]|nr:VOC family protein [Geminicoccaceae bacterium]